MKSTHENFLHVIGELVSDESKACDSETGFCRFCFALIESGTPEQVERHRPSCLWYRARLLARTTAVRRSRSRAPKTALRRHHRRAESK
jgi:hypothetical protein